VAKRNKKRSRRSRRRPSAEPEAGAAAPNGGSLHATSRNAFRRVPPIPFQTARSGELLGAGGENARLEYKSTLRTSAGSGEVLYIRVGNGTREITDSAERQKYIAKRWGNG